MTKPPRIITALVPVGAEPAPDKFSHVHQWDVVGFACMMQKSQIDPTPIGLALWKRVIPEEALQELNDEAEVAMFANRITT